MKRSTHVAATGLLLVALTGACGSKSDNNDAAAGDTTTTEGGADTTLAASKGTGENAHACDLVTTADVQTVFSADVHESSRTTDSGVSGCYFQTADHNTNVHVLRYERASDLLKNIRAADKDAKTVAGIGDDCVEEVAIGTITLVIGEIGIAISIDQTVTAAQLEQIAKISVDHFSNA